MRKCFTKSLSTYLSKTLNMEFSTANFRFLVSLNGSRIDLVAAKRTEFFPQKINFFRKEKREAIENQP